ncbi:universal stress protein [Ktedonobacter sp. SOSP1-85]|uniref:universal stress protein n=1 Tax=Ktedonobacter sp. SOSP1-85 TaxID=2778367 RepID=UPI0019162567
MFKRILVPLDGSPRAERALPLAKRIARATRGSIVLVYVVDPISDLWAVEQAPWWRCACERPRCISTVC